MTENHFSFKKSPSFLFSDRGFLFCSSFSTYLHYDPSIKDTIRRAVFEYLADPSEEDYKSIVAQIIASKTIATPKSNEDLDELIEKTLVTRKVGLNLCLVPQSRLTKHTL